MRLKLLKFTQFRGYRATTITPIDEAMTGIVGRNDYGKSTILEALAIFFETGDVKPDKSDMKGIGLADGIEVVDIASELYSPLASLKLDKDAEVPATQLGCWSGFVIPHVNATRRPRTRLMNIPGS